jgi:ABC-2 type transport system ATP-binding protein
MVHPEHLAEAQAFRPVHTRQMFGRTIMLFENANRERLAALGDLRTPGIADLFVALIGDKAGATDGAPI